MVPQQFWKYFFALRYIVSDKERYWSIYFWQLQSVRPSGGDEIILEQNLIIEKYLPDFIDRELSEEEMNKYR